MKRDYKLIIVTTLIAALAGGVPVVLQVLKERKTEALSPRLPSQVTRELRQALAASTKVYVVTSLDGNLWLLDIPPGAMPPGFTLRGQELQNFISSFVEQNGSSIWRRAVLPPPPPQDIIAVLTFSVDSKPLVDVYVYPDRLCWYTWRTQRDEVYGNSLVTQHKGDAFLLSESLLYFKQLRKYKMSAEGKSSGTP